MPEAFILASIGTFAGILPDIDSDHSTPTSLIFNLLSILAPALLLVIFIGQLQLPSLLAYAVGSILCVRYLLRPIFTAITVHRGLLHSLPAALLLALCTASLCLHVLHWTLNFSWLMACFVCGGYLAHLLLDEIYSVNFIGCRIKSSFGSALTLFSFSSWIAYSIMYATIVMGLYFMPLPAIASQMLMF